MNAQGVQPPTPQLLQALQRALGMEAATLVSLLTERLGRAQKFAVELAPSAVSAGGESTQTFTVKGLSAADVVVVNKPSRQAGLNVAQAWASADNTLSLTFANTGGASVTPTKETYRIFAFRL